MLVACVFCVSCRGPKADNSQTLRKIGEPYPYTLGQLLKWTEDPDWAIADDAFFGLHRWFIDPRIKFVSAGYIEARPIPGPHKPPIPNEVLLKIRGFRNHPDFRRRRWAVKCLGAWHHGHDAVGYLTQSLNDPHPAVAEVAAYELVRIQYRRDAVIPVKHVCRLLIRLMDVEQSFPERFRSHAKTARNSAVWTFYCLEKQGEIVLPELRKMAKDSRAEISESATEAIQYVVDPDD